MIAPLIYPMTKHIPAGKKVEVHMKNGEKLECYATRIFDLQENTEYTALYHKRKAIDQSQALGWWPVINR